MKRFNTAWVAEEIIEPLEAYDPNISYGSNIQTWTGGFIGGRPPDQTHIDKERVERPNPSSPSNLIRKGGTAAGEEATMIPIAGGEDGLCRSIRRGVEVTSPKHIKICYDAGGGKNSMLEL